MKKIMCILKIAWMPLFLFNCNLLLVAVKVFGFNDLNKFDEPKITYFSLKNAKNCCDHTIFLNTPDYIKLKFIFVLHSMYRFIHMLDLLRVNKVTYAM